MHRIASLFRCFSLGYCFAFFLTAVIQHVAQTRTDCDESSYPAGGTLHIGFFSDRLVAVFSVYHVTLSLS